MVKLISAATTAELQRTLGDEPYELQASRWVDVGRPVILDTSKLPEWWFNNHPRRTGIVVFIHPSDMEEMFKENG